jgi:hypothetical protein
VKYTGHLDELTMYTFLKICLVKYAGHLVVKSIELCKWCGPKACCAVDRMCDDI